MQAILRLALTEDGGKWLPGTILDAQPLDHKEKFGAGDLGDFFCIAVETSKYTLDELKAMRLKRGIVLTSVLSSLSLIARQSQKANIMKERRDGMVKITVPELSGLPKWNKIVNLDSGCQMFDVPIEFQPVNDLPEGF